jgi:VWFA-related protein
MKKLSTTALTFLLLFSISLAQTPQTQPPPQEPQPSPQEIAPDDVVRITTELIQTDVVVTDKNDEIIPDLTIDDFKLSENGKRQELRFVQFVSPEQAPRLEGNLEVAGHPLDPEATRNLAAKDLRRVFAFVVDDLTIPFEDVVTVRQMLTSFVDTKMRSGDLVAIVRVVGGGGALQQFTSDKRILRRAIERITPDLHNFSAFDNFKPAGQINREMLQVAAEESAAGNFHAEAITNANSNVDASEDGIIRGFRALTTINVAGDVTNSMKPLPGRKSLVLISGGLPVTETGLTQIAAGGAPIPVLETRNYLGNVNYLLKLLVDKASRAGVVINTMDIRGLKANRGVQRYTDPGNEAGSRLGSNRVAGEGRLPNMATFDNMALDTLTGHQGLQALADSTGGVSVVNSNNFNEGLDKILARSSYYILAYRPSEPFDNKFHKLEIKVTRPGAKTYARDGYYATADSARAPLSREDAIVKAAMSPLARREVDIAGRLQYRFLPEPDNMAEVDINILINANNLDFKQVDGKYKTTFDVVGFLMNSMGKASGGFSQTVTTNLSPADYKRAQSLGLSYTAHAQLVPGTYQLRAVVRETDTGRLGSMSQYLEVPDLTKKKMTASSLFLYAVDVAQANAAPQPLTALRQLPHKQDLRYAAVIYFPKVSDGKTQLTSQVIVSQEDKIIFQEPEAPVVGTVQNGQLVKIGQLGLGKARPGRYVLTLILREPGKKDRGIVRSVDFNLVD